MYDDDDEKFWAQDVERQNAHDEWWDATNYWEHQPDSGIQQLTAEEEEEERFVQSVLDSCDPYYSG